MSFEHFCFRAVQVSLHFIWYTSPLALTLVFAHGDKSTIETDFGWSMVLTLIIALQISIVAQVP